MTHNSDSQSGGRKSSGQEERWSNQPPGQDLEEVVSRASKGDREALVALYDRYAQRVFRYALVSLRNFSDAEDVTSEVFVGVLKNIGKFDWRGEGSFEAWIFRIAHNVVSTELRRKARHPVELFERSEELPAESSPSPEDSLLSNGSLGELWGRVARLPRTQRETLSLRFIAGLSAEEVGRVLGKSAGAVRVLQHRALAALKREPRGLYV